MRPEGPITLADLLVSIAVTGLLLGSTALILQHGHEAYAVGAARVEAQQGLRAALERMAIELREAGFGLHESPLDPILVAEATKVIIQQDLDGDGATGANGEQLTYLLAGTTLRRDAGGGAQPLLDGVGWLRFEYLDAQRRPAVLPRTICSVVISLSAGPPSTFLRLPFPVTVHGTTEVLIRNRRFRLFPDGPAPAD
jgi:hypothetical protein